MERCDFCGVEVADEVRGWRERLTCGAPACERWAVETERAEVDAAMQDAMDDGFERYRR